MPIDKDKLGAIGNNGKSTYEIWMEGQGVPIITGFYIEDMNEVELKPWAWKGGKGAILNLEGIDETNNSYLCEIAPGGKLNPMKHVYEEMVYILNGRGATKIWQDGQPPLTFEWQAGSLFNIPLNANYQHFNGSGTEPVRYLAVTTMPLIINLYHNLEFVFNCPFTFTDRFGGEDNYFNGEGTAHPNRIWDTNFIADVDKLPLLSWNERGKGSTNRMIEMAHSVLGGHVSEMEVGKYKKAHRHGPGAHVIIVAGEGYSLMWPEGSEPQKFDWKPNSVIVPPDQWFHQHFNLSPVPAKYLAMRNNSRKYRVMKQYKVDEDVKKGGSQIELKDENPRILELFTAELAKRGLTPNMAAELYVKN